VDSSNLTPNINSPRDRTYQGRRLHSSGETHFAILANLRDKITAEEGISGCRRSQWISDVIPLVENHEPTCGILETSCRTATSPSNVDLPDGSWTFSARLCPNRPGMREDQGRMGYRVPWGVCNQLWLSLVIGDCWDETIGTAVAAAIVVSLLHRLADLATILWTGLTTRTIECQSKNRP